jgi:YmgG-like glycine-zipper protein
MNRKLPSLALALFAAGACGRGANRNADTSLNNDLSLAAQAKGYQPLDSMSAAERAAATSSPNALNGRTPVATSSTARPTTHHTTSTGDVSRTHRTSTASSTQSGEVVVKHTQRDAAIGAAAGAVIGATTSRNKVKGGVIGAAVGGILGGVIGNNVDKTKKKP